MLDIIYDAARAVVRVCYTQAEERQQAILLRWALVHLLNRDLNLGINAARVVVTHVVNAQGDWESDSDEDMAPPTPPQSPR